MDCDSPCGGGQVSSDLIRWWTGGNNRGKNLPKGNYHVRAKHK